MITQEPLISEIVNYLGQVTSEVKWDKFRSVARETMFVNKQMYPGNPLLRYYFDCHCLCQQYEQFFGH